MSKKHKKKDKVKNTEPVQAVNESTVTIAENGDPIMKHNYAPNGTDHELQRAITNFLHNRVMEDERLTLAELGYLHINTLTYDQRTGEIHLRIYFDARLAARVIKSAVNQERKVVPVDELRIFENYLYVGDLTNAVTYAKIMAPKSKVVEDEKHRASLVNQNNDKYVETHALVLNCNLMISMAAVHGIDFTDPNFTMKCTTVGKGGKNAVKSIVTTVSQDEVPVGVTVTQTYEQQEYNPNGAIPYLTMLRDGMIKAYKNQKKLEDKVRGEAKSKKKDRENRQQSSKFFNKYA